MPLKRYSITVPKRKSMPRHSGATQGNTQFGQETGGRAKGSCVQKPLLWFPQEETGEVSDLLNMATYACTASCCPPTSLQPCCIFIFSSTCYLLCNLFINYAYCLPSPPYPMYISQKQESFCVFFTDVYQEPRTFLRVWNLRVDAQQIFAE